MAGWVTVGHDVKSKIGHSTDLRSFLMNWVEAAHETEKVRLD